MVPSDDEPGTEDRLDEPKRSMRAQAGQKQASYGLQEFFVQLTGLYTVREPLQARFDEGHKHPGHDLERPEEDERLSDPPASQIVRLPIDNTDRYQAGSGRDNRLKAVDHEIGAKGNLSLDQHQTPPRPGLGNLSRTVLAPRTRPVRRVRGSAHGPCGQPLVLRKPAGPGVVMPYDGPRQQTTSPLSELSRLST